MQPKVKFLTVVWGETYIERFCALSLPSFLAPGNLPALAHATDLEVVIMTRRSDFAHFEKNVAFKRLTAVCPVRFVGIDDLIATGIYGVTLTLAYARPIIACGEDMLHTHFVFMNADFVLADGSLHALGKHIYEGRSIVLAPSFRATAEKVEPKLEVAFDPAEGVLNIAPRRMVEMSLASPHRTMIAKTRYQSVFHSTHPNQFFWQVDEHTVLGRYFLIFMLCLKPERLIQSINCYCDYSFIPELCPSGDEVVMNDSDDFFMLELQSREQETHMLRHGPLSEPRIARSLQEWTTAEHRRAASYDIVFHSRNVPPGIGAAKAEAQSFVDRVKSRLGRPKSHVNHKYWIYGAEDWKERRKEKGLSASVSELAPYSKDIRFHIHRALVRTAKRVRTALATCRNAVMLGFPSRSLLSPYWCDFQLLQETAAAVVAGSGSRPVLAVGRSDGRLIADVLRTQPRIRVVREKDMVRDDLMFPRSESSQEYTQVLLCPEAVAPESLWRTIDRCLSIVAPKGVLNIVLNLNASASSDARIGRLVFGLGDVFGNRVEGFSLRSVGGKAIGFNRRFHAWMAAKFGHYYRRFGAIAFAWGIPVLAIGVTFNLATNLFSMLRRPSKKLVRNCSSVVIQARVWGRGQQGETAARPPGNYDATR